MADHAHWDEVYARRPADQLTWHQPEPTGIRLATRHHFLPTRDHVVDIGAGAAGFAAAAAATGARVTALDLSQAALDVARARIESAEVAARIHWLAGDVLDPSMLVQTPPIGLWHDRAVFHFLTDDAAISAYRRRLVAAIRPGGGAIVGTFADDGPERCSGLPTRRYSPDALADALGPSSLWERVETLRETHVSPAGRAQRFAWVVLRRRVC